MPALGDDTYRILVTGSREWDNSAVMEPYLQDAYWYASRMGYTPVLVHGACPTGADQMADEVWTLGTGLEPERHPADWSVGKAAGFIRNKQMVDLGAWVCLAFCQAGAGNKGTDHCAGLAEAAGIPVRRIWSDGRVE